MQRQRLGFVLGISVVVALTVAAQSVGLGAVAAEATPMATPSSCAKPDFESWSVSPTQVTSGDRVTISGQRVEGCQDPQPPHDYRLLARHAGSTNPFIEVDRATSGPDGAFQFLTNPLRSMQYNVLIDGRDLFGAEPPNDTVTVDRTTGGCTNVVTLTGPARVAAGSLVNLHGRSSEPGTVAIEFRRRGEVAYTIRRQLTPASDGSFSTSFSPVDDFRIFASQQRCDSTPLLTQINPIITGPAFASRGASIQVSVRGPADVSLAVYFKRNGETQYTLGRTGRLDTQGVYRTTYRAAGTYSYYAVTGPDHRRTGTATTAVN